jgi:formylglycine-generating enzyme required for sulfatase activity
LFSGACALRAPEVEFSLQKIWKFLSSLFLTEVAMNTMSKQNISLLSWALFLGVLCTQSLGAQTARLIVQHSNDLGDWQEVTVTPEMLDEGHVLHGLSGEGDLFRLIVHLDEEPEPPEMILVEGGTLPESSPMGAVPVDDFWVGRVEVTWGHWKEVRSWAVDHGYDLAEAGLGCEDDHPVRSVTWYEAIKWCNAKSEKEGLSPVYRDGGSIFRSGKANPDASLSAGGYRLPREAEWEFAARGGNQSGGYNYAGSNDLDTVGWYNENSFGATCDLHDGSGTWPVARKAPNELGLYDLSGNVREFCWDATTTFSNIRIRGGGWAEPASAAALDYRRWTGPDVRYHTNGLRLFRTPAP